MNIFFLSYLQAECAKWHVNSHTGKLIIESVQLLCSAHHILGSSDGFVPPYKLTHKNHPCAVWVRESADHYDWLVELARELGKEFTYRYGKIHKSSTYLDALAANRPAGLKHIGFTEPPQCMPDEYKVQGDAVSAYRNYYARGKVSLHVWKKRSPPEWLEAHKEKLDVVSNIA